MNFSYGIIGIVGILAAISIGFISMDPTDIIEPRIVVEEKVVACTLQWDPMCGVDGKTYGNMCMLDAADVKLDYQGECVVVDSEPKIKPCTKDYRPMCGVDGKTYGNMCTLESSGITLDYQGECVVPEPTSEPVACTMDYTPVCGVDGKTYGNMCMLDAADVKLDYQGECVITEPTPELESLPITAIVSIPVGAAVPGCEDTNECYLPYETNVAKGATVSWINDDSAAHTVTSGTVTAGVTGVFDSSLFMAGDVYEFTFDEAGKYDYFCMVHPWMTGIVNVN